MTETQIAADEAFERLNEWYNFSDDFGPDDWAHKDIACVKAACNAHDNLIEALKTARHRILILGGNTDEINALLKQVEGK